jgi:hypothetical protein
MHRSILLAMFLSTGVMAQTTPVGAAPIVPGTYPPAQPMVHGPDHHAHALRGVVDTVNTITLEDLVRMGVDSARARYSGKIVTFRDMCPVGVSAKNEERTNVCMQGFLRKFRPYIGSVGNGSLLAFFNYGEEVSGWLKHTPYRPQDLKVEHPLNMSEDICDTARVCNEGDPEGDRKCIFSSDRILVAGKIMSISVGSNGWGFNVFLLPTGVRY